MSSYHIWHPAYVSAEPLVLEMFITLGDTIFLSRGSGTFVQAVLKALELAIEPVSWQMEPMRSHYFNSYRGTTGDWEDEWDLAWRLRMAVAAQRAPALPDPPGWGYFDLDAADGNYRPADAPTKWNGWHCLILADAPDLSIIPEARHIVETAHPESKCVLGKAFGRYPQLRCDLGYFPRSYYEQGALEAEALLEQLSRTGASVRFQGLDKERREQGG